MIFIAGSTHLHSNGSDMIRKVRFVRTIIKALCCIVFYVFHAIISVIILLHSRH
jgi:hypothetical protein